MKRIGTAALYALFFEFGLGCVTLFTCAACASGNPRGLTGIFVGMVWMFHAMGFGLAKLLTDSNTPFWIIMLGASYLQWTFIFWLIMYLRNRKAAKMNASSAQNVS